MGHKESNQRKKSHFNQYSVAYTCTRSQFVKKSNKKKHLALLYLLHIFNFQVQFSLFEVKNVKPDQTAPNEEVESGSIQFEIRPTL